MSSPITEISVLAKLLRNERSELLSAVGLDVISIIVSRTSVVTVNADAEVPLLALLRLGSVVLLLRLPLRLLLLLLLF